MLGFVLFNMLILDFFSIFALLKFLVAFVYFIPLYFVVSIILPPFLRVLIQKHPEMIIPKGWQCWKGDPDWLGQGVRLKYV